ncbi:MAG: phytanoyl-CoA dioxygenase family protein [Alphaproteobacteria bacterium]|nr:phytanoyl-CoA dioxygenase family protein [Alphaproteobacteria bacterium]
MTLTLSDSQLRRFDTEGWLFFEDVFSADEAAVLRAAADTVYAMDRKEVVREKDGKTARTAFAAHTFNEAFGRLGRHPRLIEPVRQILGGDVYMHQYKVNAKAAFNGDVWQWHQDYGTWSRDDLMPDSRAMNIAVFLDDVTEFNGALMFIPQSHRKGVIEAGHDLETTSYPLWTIDEETISRLVAEGGIVSPKGKAGSVILFHGNLVHCSPANMSPFDRTIVYLSLCHVENHIRQFKRPEWIAHRDFTPIDCLADDCLVDLADENAAAAE